MEETSRIYSLRPLLPKEPVLLILGSMPSAMSLEKQQYYAHARNHFWPLMARVLREEESGDYTKRTAMLLKHRIALWDSVHSCNRAGSLDQHIQNAEPNDIPALLENHPSIRAVAFNGAMAEKVYDKYFPRTAGRSYMRLPSSSPVPSSRYRRMEDKVEAWMALRAYLTV